MKTDEREFNIKRYLVLIVLGEILSVFVSHLIDKKKEKKIQILY